MMLTHEQAMMAEQRAADAAAAAQDLGWSPADVTAASRRAEREYRAGLREGTESFAGKVSIGTRPDGSKALSIYTYTGNVVDPRARGLAGASTLD